ncbi:efflux RND transporter periplasmic adaptor subunit [Pedobacter sp.]|uniref:efflux RND transporter periplasmic adaptor subunit n=1 Tax=Pedobacter sp. TaxID=1411316 RepID=UPI003D7F9578
METKHIIRILTMILLVPLLFFTACNQAEKEVQQGKAVSYTCPMHPQIVQDKKGTCPICAMDLVPFEKSNAELALHLDERQRSLANISTMAMATEGMETFKQLNGRLIINPEKITYISSRVAGRLDRLFVKQTGEKITKGQPLYQIYAEELASLQQEYLLALATAAEFPADKTFKQILQSAKQKLKLYGQTEAQLQTLQQHKKTNPNITFLATESGTVAELAVTEGQYVTEGSALMRIEGYQSLWVEADIYPAELADFKQGQKVKVVIPGYDDQPQMVSLNFVNPELQASSQLIQVRGTLPNPNNQWQPGLQANIFVPSQSKGNGMSLPVNAVIRDGNGSHVWIETAKGKFEPRKVTTGMESFDAVEIKEGLQKGDQVVVTGAYLLYSEYILKKGKNPMSHHN